ncbi:MAG: c-type cytochrome domain-containing protein, partial [Planctomycetota bacterium]|nr:c-type cytochrome domain-containing protein [Planctomycetota bacterium]
MFVFIWSVIAATVTSASTLGQNTVASVIQDRCLDCHDESTSEAGVNLELLISTESPLDPKVIDLWTRVERVVTKREMPPSQEEHLTEKEIVLIQDFYRTKYILKNNKEHIGPTPLRRLTKYELLNSLEDLLLFRGSNPHFKNAVDAFDREALSKIIPSDRPGVSGFDNDATRMERLKLPLREIADTVHLAMEHFRQTPILQEEFFGGESLTEEMISEHQAKNLIETFIRRACRANPSRNQQLTQNFY